MSSIPLGYKQTEAGVIPDDWEANTIGQVASFSGGAQPPRSTFKFVPEPGYIRLIQIRDYKSSANETYIPEAMAKKRCTAQDIMIGRYGPPIFQILKGIEGAYNVALIKATPNFLIDQNYFFNVLKQDNLFQLIDSLSRRTSGQTGIEMPALKAFPIPLPPLPEQRIIASTLADMDALLDSVGKLLTKKRQMKQAAMQELLTGRKRLEGFGGEWEEVQLAKIATFLNNGVNSRAELTEYGSVKYLHYGDIHKAISVFVDATSAALPYLPSEKADRLHRLRDGDLVLADASEDVAGVGKAVEVKNVDGVDFVAGLHTIAIRFADSSLAKGFIGYLQFMPSFQNHLRSMAAGTKVYAIAAKHVASAALLLPSLPEQRAIAVILSDMEAEIDALEERLAKTRDLKQGMMQELLTGRTRLV